MVLDLGLPDIDGLELHRGDQAAVAASRELPVIVYTGSEPDRRGGRTQLERLGRRRTISRTSGRPSGCSTRRRSSCTGSIAELAGRRAELLEQLHETDRVLAGKKVLIVDDDVRNIFALTSMLERQQMKVISAETGKRGDRHAPRRRRTSTSC